MAIIDKVHGLFRLGLRGLWRALRSNLGYVLLGGIIAVIGVNFAAGPGTYVIPLGEAEGAEFSNPDTVDLVSKVSRKRDCPARSQRYAWRWRDYNGRHVQQIIPLRETVAPFLADSDEVMVTVPTTDVPDRLQREAGWMYRVVTDENCGWLPEWLGHSFGSRLTRSPDKPLNFIGAPHEK